MPLLKQFHNVKQTHSKNSCRQFILASDSVSVKTELTVITKRILCHAKKLCRPAESLRFSMTSFCLVSCRRSGVVCWPNFCGVRNASADRPTCTNYNSYLRRIGLVLWEHWYSLFFPQVRTNGTSAISGAANIEVGLNVELHGWEIPNLVLCESEKNLEVPFKKNVLDWVNATRELIGCQFPAEQQEKYLH